MTVTVEEFPQTTTLGMPLDNFDPSAEEQRQFFERFVSEHPGSDRRYNLNPSRPELSTSKAAEALADWRHKVASERWTEMLHLRCASPGCECCGTATSQRARVGGRELFVCGPCLAVVRSLQAQRSSKDKLADGRSRAQAAEALLEQLGG